MGYKYSSGGREEKGNMALVKIVGFKAMEEGDVLRIETINKLILEQIIAQNFKH